MSEAEVGETVEWVRAERLFRELEKHKAVKARPALFDKRIEPADVAQGQLGDCWLLSAFSCLAEIPGAVKRVFVTKQFSWYGKYKVRLFDVQQDKWVNITVDDHIPCKKGTVDPIFAEPNGAEAWVLILEKAFAKLCGGYSQLDGGHALWALKTLTGDQCIKYSRIKGKGAWKRLEMTHKEGAESKRAVQFWRAGEQVADDDMFQTFKKFDTKDSVLAAGTEGNDDTQSIDGLVKGHAYSLIKVKEVEGFRLLCLRNPWGSFEWKGAWSDTSPLWEQHPAVKKHCKPLQIENDGRFWMEWGDFLKYYSTVDVCARTRRVDDIVLDLHETMGACGPAYGCCTGCARYWCCCQGAVAMCTQTDSESVASLADKGYEKDDDVPGQNGARGGQRKRQVAYDARALAGPSPMEPPEVQVAVEARVRV